MTPERLGPFVLYQRLEGHEGEAYRARRVVSAGQLSGPVCVQVFEGARRSLAEALVNVASWGSRVAHPGVVRLLEVGTCEGRLYAVSELAEGRDLAEALGLSLQQKRSPSVPLALAVGAQLARLGREVHEAGADALGAFWPRDVVLGFDGRVRVRARGATEAPAPGSGRDPFVAPEIARGGSESAKSDAWTVARVLRAVLAVDVEGKKTPKVSHLYKDTLGPILLEALARSPADRLSLGALEHRLLDVLHDTDDSPTRLVVELLADLSGGALPSDQEPLELDDLDSLAREEKDDRDVLYPSPRAPSRRQAREHPATLVGPAPEGVHDKPAASSLFGRVLAEAERELAEVSDDGEPEVSREDPALADSLDDQALDLDAIARSSLDDQPAEEPPGTAVVERPPALPADLDDDDGVFRDAGPLTRASRSISREELWGERDEVTSAPTFSKSASERLASLAREEPSAVFTGTIRPAELASDGQRSTSASSSTKVMRSSRSKGGSSVEKGAAPSPTLDPEKTAYLENPAAAFRSQPGAKPASAPALAIDDYDEPPTERLSQDLVEQAIRLSNKSSAPAEGGGKTGAGASGWGKPLMGEADPSSPQQTALLPVHDVRQVLSKGDPRGQTQDPPTLDSILPEDPEQGLLVIDVPDGAVVFVNGDQRGKGRTVLENLDRFASFVVRVHHRGHAPWTGTVTLKGMRAARVEPELRKR